MTRPLGEILADPDDEALCMDLYFRISEHYGSRMAEMEESDFTDEERVVVLAIIVKGVVDNGGFRYLFERDLPGDLYYGHAAQAFSMIGAREAARAFHDTLALFPNSRPPRDGSRLRHYLKQVTTWPTPQDDLFMEAGPEIYRCLAAYIRSRMGAFERFAADPPPEDDPTERTEREESAGPLDELSHWKRVAFAARCARRVFPLLARHWPDIPARFPRGVLDAIERAEQSAAQEKPVAGLKEAQYQALFTGVAATSAEFLATLHAKKCADDPDQNPSFAVLVQGERPPRDLHEGSIVQIAAKSAEKAAEAALTTGEDSAKAALEAWSYAEQAASMAGDEALLAALNLAMQQIQPADGADDDLSDEESVSPLVLRGKRLFLLFAVPQVLLEVLRIVTALSAGLESVRWSTQVFGPSAVLVGMYLLWRGAPESIRWLVVIGSIFHGGLPLVSIIARTIGLLSRVGAGPAIVAFGLVGWPLVPIILASSVHLTAGLVYLFSPSVKEFLRHQREVAERR